MGPRWPKMAPRWPKTAQDRPKTGPSRSQDGPRRLQDASRETHDGPKIGKHAARMCPDGEDEAGKVDYCSKGVSDTCAK